MTAPAVGEWVLVDGRHVQRVGVGRPPQADRMVELPGTTVLPGFVDAHVHLTSTGLSLAKAEVEAAASADELLAVAAARRAAGETGRVLLQGYDETRWARPGRADGSTQLDAGGVAPLIIRRTDGHVALANTAALGAAGASMPSGVDATTRAPRPGVSPARRTGRLGRWLTAGRSPTTSRGAPARGGGGGGRARDHGGPRDGDAGVARVGRRGGAAAASDPPPRGRRAGRGDDGRPAVLDLGLPSIGGDLPDRRLHRAPARPRWRRRTSTATGTASLSRGRRARPRSSTTGTTPGSRSACTRSATARSSRCWHVGARLPGARLPRAAALPCAAPPDRARRDGLADPGGARGGARHRGVRATRVRRDRGAAGAALRAGGSARIVPPR